MKTKADAKIEAARLAVDSEAENFTEKATEIYDFLTSGISLPDVENTFDPSLLTASLTKLNSVSPTSDESKKPETAEA